jgi:hypothetical protein
VWFDGAPNAAEKRVHSSDFHTLGPPNWPELGPAGRRLNAATSLVDLAAPVDEEEAEAIGEIDHSTAMRPPEIAEQRDDLRVWH